MKRKLAKPIRETLKAYPLVFILDVIDNYWGIFETSSWMGTFTFLYVVGLCVYGYYRIKFFEDKNPGREYELKTKTGKLFIHVAWTSKPGIFEPQNDLIAQAFLFSLKNAMVKFQDDINPVELERHLQTVLIRQDADLRITNVRVLITDTPAPTSLPKRGDIILRDE